MLIVFIILIYPIICAFTVAHLNARGMLPGTKNYKQIQNVEAARSAAIMARYRATEDEFLGQRMKALEAPK